MAVDAKKFLQKVEEIAYESPSYRLGGSGKDGTCDCIGLIIGAIRRAGGEWNGIRGSNYAARSETEGLRTFCGNSDLMVGEVVYKSRKPGEKGYNLPEKYSLSGDKLDYYHVGVVESVYPLRIRHMTTPEPKMDTSIGRWSHHGWLRKVAKSDGINDGQEGGGTMGETVYIAGGNVAAPIHMRSGDSLNRKILKEIPQGAEAELIEYSTNWSKIKYGNTIGYVASVFVHRNTDEAAAISQDANGEMITIERKRLEKVYDEIGDLLGLRG